MDHTLHMVMGVRWDGKCGVVSVVCIVLSGSIGGVGTARVSSAVFYFGDSHFAVVVVVVVFVGSPLRLLLVLGLVMGWALVAAQQEVLWIR